MGRQPLQPGEYGEISVHKGKTSWRARVRHRTKFGKLVQLEASGKTKTDAKRRLKARIATQTIENTVRLSTCITQAMSTAEKRVLPQTLKGYKGYAEKLIQQYGDIPMSRLTPIMIEDITNSYRKGQQRSVMSVLGLACKEAVRMGVITHSPMSGVDVRMNKKQVKSLTVQQVKEIRAIIQAHNVPELANLIDTLLGTGVRIGEAMALEWDDYSPKDKTLFIHKTTVGIKIQDHTKAHKRYVVQLPEFTVAALENQRTLSTSQYIFSTKKGTPIHYGHLAKTLRDVLPEKYGWVTFHTFRKTVATTLVD